jgi:hypothetical protein
LGIKLNNCGFWVFANFWRQYLNAFQDKEPLYQFLNVFLRHVQIQIVHVTFVYIIVFDDFLYLTTVW